ncbi:MAG TPA: hypothetical protein VIL55_01420 [Naasia sp.]
MNALELLDALDLDGLTPCRDCGRYAFHRPDCTRNFVIRGEWVAAEVNGCTCGSAGVNGLHESHCGLEPVALLVDMLIVEGTDA